MREIKAPDSFYNPKSVFLGGSIENGAAEMWQEKVVARLNTHWSDQNVNVLNPRRDNWDPTWVNDPNNQEMRQQVDWELSGIINADVVAFYFDPNTQSPISLMELGIAAALKPEATVVYCPKGYWKRGNVYFVCKRFGVQFLSDNPIFTFGLEGFADAIRETLRQQRLGKPKSQRVPL